MRKTLLAAVAVVSMLAGSAMAASTMTGGLIGEPVMDTAGNMIGSVTNVLLGDDADMSVTGVVVKGQTGSYVVPPRKLTHAAGGGLTLSLLLALREAGAKMPRAAVTMSPWTDLSCSSGTYSRHRSLDPIIDKEGLSEAGLWYAGSRDPKDPMASPMFADLHDLPPILVQVGGDETMLDDGRIFAERARAAGVDVTYQLYDGMWHVHQSGAPDVPEAVAAYNDIAAFIRAQFND